MDLAKKAAGKKAAEWIESGMIVGLGTGSTSAYFLEALIEKKLNIQVVSSSEATTKLAIKGGLKVIDINDAPHIDITVDGADEIDAKKRMIKGGGGALLREKILAASSKEMVVIVDESKFVDSVGHTKLPIEIIPYGSSTTKKRVESLGYKTTWRLGKTGALYLTDNKNLILDLHFLSPPTSPEKENDRIHQIPGVIDTGFFFGLAGRVIIGYANGTVKVLP